IGKRGQNARLSSKLTGWQVDIEAEAPTAIGFDEKIAQAVQGLAAIPGISPAHADALVHHGITSLEALLQVEVSDLAEMPEIGEAAAAVIDAAKAAAKSRSFDVGGDAAGGISGEAVQANGARPPVEIHTGVNTAGV